MKLIHGNRLVLDENEDYVIVMKREGPNVWDPADEVWGQAQGFKVVTAKATGTFVMVPLGAPVKVRATDFKPGDLTQHERLHPFDMVELLNGLPASKIVYLYDRSGLKDQITIDGKTYVMDVNVKPRTRNIR